MMTPLIRKRWFQRFRKLNELFGHKWFNMHLDNGFWAQGTKIKQPWKMYTKHWSNLRNPMRDAQFPTRAAIRNLMFCYFMDDYNTVYKINAGITYW